MARGRDGRLFTGAERTSLFMTSSVDDDFNAGRKAIVDIALLSGRTGLYGARTEAVPPVAADGHAAMVFDRNTSRQSARRNVPGRRRWRCCCPRRAYSMPPVVHSCTPAVVVVVRCGQRVRAHAPTRRVVRPHPVKHIRLVARFHTADWPPVGREWSLLRSS